MSWLPPFSRGGAVRAASPATRAYSDSGSEPRTANSGSGGSASGGTRVGSVSINACSREFHLQQFRGWRGTHQAGVDQTGEGDAGDVPGGGNLPAEIPDRLVGIGKDVGEETAAVALGEDPGVP